jgi:hypothetical protein
MAQLATIEVAKDMYTDVEVKAVDKALAAGNVSPSDIKIPTASPTAVSTGEPISGSPTGFTFPTPSPSPSLRNGKT